MSDEKRCTDLDLQEILWRVKNYMLMRLKGQIDQDSPEYLSPQELNSMVKLLKDNGIRVKLTEEDMRDPMDPYGFLQKSAEDDDLDVPETFKH